MSSEWQLVDGSLCTYDELVAIVQSIKCAYPDYGSRKVHREIVDVAAEKEPRLASVKLGDVKKVWKKLGLSEFAMAQQTKGEVLKFYTVGDGSVQNIIDRYHSAADAFTKARENKSDTVDGTNAEISDLGKFTHLWLDVPGDRSGTKPYQALINFNENKGKGKKGGKHDVNDIVKIQIAAAGDGIPKSTPMLLYNSDRSAKTFIHPDADGYEKIRDLIKDHGAGGSLGSNGGTKGYFHCRILKSHGVVAVDSTSLAPTQSW